jgi:excisionase family DNA binding protein
MRSRIEYKKVCKQCGKIFVAGTSVTKYCSVKCSNLGSKAEKREKLLQSESIEIQERNKQKLLSKEFLSISESAILLGISRPTIYKMLANGEIKSIRASERIVRIKRSDLENIKSSATSINTIASNINKSQYEQITVAEVIEKFNISTTYFYRKIKIADIKPTIIKGKAHYPLKPLQKIFARKQYVEIADWYSVADIVKKFKVRKEYVYEYTSEHKIPKKRVGNNVLISQYHWDNAHGLNKTENENYYTVEQAIKKYKIGRNHLYDLIRNHKIPKVKRGINVLIHKKSLDNLMSNRKR